ncbi:IS110 family transposase [Mesorhizobium argentiipisi]|uniref:Transposase n=1 Tax=Mesorhizobium argentiipisi TaxID=3015175 RepID=A0ABU8K901_9HYPH
MAEETSQDVGIDVAKRWLDVSVFQTQEHARFDNDQDGWTKLIKWLTGRTVRAIGMEPSGGYERGVAKALRKAGPLARNVNPHKPRHYARALGRMAKNDRNDALLELGPGKHSCSPLSGRENWTPTFAETSLPVGNRQSNTFPPVGIMPTEPPK